MQSWFSKIVKKKAKKSEIIKDIPNNLWVQCPSCQTSLFGKDLEKNLHVCSSCDFHMHRPIALRMQDIFDNAKFIDIDLPKGLSDPLKFKDREKYTDRLKKYRAATGHNDALRVAYGKVGGYDAVCAFFDFKFMGGSMGSAVGDGLVTAFDYALAKKIPCVVFTASGGARMQEGIMSLMQMARVTAMVNKMNEAGLPYIVVLNNPTMGGVTASFGMIGDIHIAEKGAIVGFAGPRVIEQTIRSKLPEGFQTAEYLEDHGMVDITAARKDLKTSLARVISNLVG